MNIAQISIFMKRLSIVFMLFIAFISKVCAYEITSISKLTHINDKLKIYENQGILYASQVSRLVAYDVTEYDNLQELGELYYDSPVREMIIQDSIMFAFNFDGAIVSLDIASTANMNILDSVPLPYPNNYQIVKLFIHQNILYVLHDGTVTKLNISNPESIQIVGSFYSIAKDIAFTADYFYIKCYGEIEIWNYDTTGGYQSSFAYGGPDDGCIAIVDTLLYDLDESGIVDVYSISEPLNPELINTIANENNVEYYASKLHRYQDFFIIEGSNGVSVYQHEADGEIELKINFRFMSPPWSRYNSLIVLDEILYLNQRHNWTSPVSIDRFFECDYDAGDIEFLYDIYTPSVSGYPFNITKLDENRIFSIGRNQENNSSISIYLADYNNPLIPEFSSNGNISSSDIDEGHLVYAVDTTTLQLYFGCSTTNLYRSDLNVLNYSSDVEEYHLPNIARNLQVKNGFLYIASVNGIESIELPEFDYHEYYPEYPNLVNGCQDVSILYFLAHNANEVILYVLEEVTPGEIELRGELLLVNIEETPENMVVEEGTLFFNTSSEIYLINVQDAENPFYAGQIQYGDTPLQDIIPNNDQLFTIDENDIIKVYDVLDPLNIIMVHDEAASNHGQGDFYSIEANGNFLYALNDLIGITCYDISSFSNDYYNALIISGGGIQPDNFMYFMTNTNPSIRYAYNILANCRLYLSGHIHYMSPLAWQDVNGDGIPDDIIDEVIINPGTVRDAILNLEDVNDQNRPNIIFLSGHGGVNEFDINGDENSNISADTLAVWLDMAQLETNTPLVVLIEACFSGSFVDDLAAENRVVITSSQEDEISFYFNSDCFATNFWTEIWDGEDIRNSFLNARNVVTEATNHQQTPLLDADGDGIPNTMIDLEIVTDMYIGGNLDPGAGLPVLVDHPTGTTPQGDTVRVDILANGIMDEVWFRIYPLHYQGTPPVESLPHGDLYHQGDYLYSMHWVDEEGFLDPDSTYLIEIQALDDYINLSIPRIVVLNPSLGINTNSTALPLTNKLYQNYPNPFNSSTIIRYHLARTSDVSIKVFNILGQEVMTLLDQQQQAGQWQLSWNGKDQSNRQVASGVYIIYLETKYWQETQKILLMK